MRLFSKIPFSPRILGHAAAVKHSMLMITDLATRSFWLLLLLLSTSQPQTGVASVRGKRHSSSMLCLWKRWKQASPAKDSQFTQQTRLDLLSGCSRFQPTSVGQDCPHTLSCPLCWAQSPPSTFPLTYQVGQYLHRSNESPACLKRIAAGTPDQPWIQGRNPQGINQWGRVDRRAEQQPTDTCAAHWELLARHGWTKEGSGYTWRPQAAGTS